MAQFFTGLILVAFFHTNCAWYILEKLILSFRVEMDCIAAI